VRRHSGGGWDVAAAGSLPGLGALTWLCEARAGEMTDAQLAQVAEARVRLGMTAAASSGVAVDDAGLVAGAAAAGGEQGAWLGATIGAGALRVAADTGCRLLVAG
jgi:hypothetical protein